MVRGCSGQILTSLATMTVTACCVKSVYNIKLFYVQKYLSNTSNNNITLQKLFYKSMSSTFEDILIYRDETEKPNPSIHRTCFLVRDLVYMIKVWSRFIATGTHYISSRQSSKIFFFYNKKKKGGMQAQEKHLSCTRLTNCCIERCPTFEGWEVPGPGRLQCVICWQLGLTGPVMAEIQWEREKGGGEREV